jgi:hypothetical protein
MNTHKHILITAIFVMMFSGMMACGAPGFFTAEPTFSISGSFTFKDNQYLDSDGKGQTSSNTLSEPQSINAPAQVSGFVSKEEDPQDCFKFDALKNDSVELKQSNEFGVGELVLDVYDNNKSKIHSANINEVVALTSSQEYIVCINAEIGDSLYLIDITSSQAANQSRFSQLDIILVNNEGEIENLIVKSSTSPLNSYEFSLEGKENGQYKIYAGVDLNQNNRYCEVGEICAFINKSFVSLKENMPNLSSLDVKVCMPDKCTPIGE